MTENEALEILSLNPKMKKEMPNLAEVYEVAVKALEEIREYRAIGTPAQIFEKIGGLDVELGKYACIGTVEECRTAVERMKPKKATDVRYFGEAGYYIGLCPSCNEGNNSEYQYCGNCGQAIDWSKENE